MDVWIPPIETRYDSFNDDLFCIVVFRDGVMRHNRRSDRNQGNADDNRNSCDFHQGKILTSLTASPILNVPFEIVPEQTQRAQDRWARHVDQGAVPLAAIEIEDFLKLIE